MSLASSLDGQVALVTGGDERTGRAIALLLSSRGARVVVVGKKERSLGEVVGEIANAGGKARHVVGDPSDVDVVAAAVSKALDVFGALHVVVSSEPAAVLGAESLSRETAVTLALFRAAAPRMTSPGHLIAVSADSSALSALNALARELDLAARAIACRAVPASADADADSLAALVAASCMREAGI